MRCLRAQRYLVLFLLCTCQLSHAEKGIQADQRVQLSGTPSRESAGPPASETAEAALLEIVHGASPPYMASVGATNLIKDPVLGPQVRRLVGFTRHPDERVQTAARNVLALLEPGADLSISPEHWEKWLARLDGATNSVAANSAVQGTPEDVLSDLVWIRTHIKPRPKLALAAGPKSLAALKRTVGYLKNPDRRLRTAAYVTLIGLQEDCFGGPDSADAWETWLTDLEQRVKDQAEERSGHKVKAAVPQ